MDSQVDKEDLNIKVLIQIWLLVCENPQLYTCKNWSIKRNLYNKPGWLNTD